MDTYRNKIARMNPSSLVNKLLRLIEEHTSNPPDNEALLNESTSKIVFSRHITSRNFQKLSSKTEKTLPTFTKL